LKLDFTKAFDTIEHNTILEMMKHMGFDDKWRFWTQKILGSGSSAILLNGVPGKQFQCKRGVRQGDILQCIVNKAHLEGLFELPILAYEGAGYPIVQYADDTILVMKASQRELFILKGLLESFSQSTGLRVNYGKSCMVPLNTTMTKLSYWQEFLDASWNPYLLHISACQWELQSQEWSTMGQS
jgi:hypothetical protein